MRNRSPSSRGAQANDTAVSRGRPERFRTLLAARYRADQGTTIATGVSQWNDLTGNARHLTQATGSLQPLPITSATNGKPALRFDGSDDYLGPVTFTQAQPLAVSLVYKSIALGASGAHDIAMDGGTAATTALITNNTPAWAVFGGSSLSSATAVANGAYAYVTMVYSGNSSVGYVNGSQLVAGAAGANAAGGFTIGGLANGTRVANIEVAEAAMWNAIPDSSTLARSNNYQRSWFGL